MRENHAPHFYGNVKLGLHISMETGPATQSPVAEVESCSTSAFWPRRRPATTPRQVAGLSSVAGRCVFGIVNRPLHRSGLTRAAVHKCTFNGHVTCVTGPDGYSSPPPATSKRHPENKVGVHSCP